MGLFVRSLPGVIGVQGTVQEVQSETSAVNTGSKSLSFFIRSLSLSSETNSQDGPSDDTAKLHPLQPPFLPPSQSYQSPRHSAHITEPHPDRP